MLSFTWATIYLLVACIIADCRWIQRLLREVLLILHTCTSIAMRWDRQLKSLRHCLSRVEAWMISITGLIHFFCSLISRIFIVVAGRAGCRHIYTRSYDHLIVLIVFICSGYLLVQRTLVTQRWGRQMDLRCRLLKRRMSCLSLRWSFCATTKLIDKFLETQILLWCRRLDRQIGTHFPQFKIFIWLNFYSN